MHRSLRTLACAALALLSLAADAPTPITIPLIVHVAARDGDDVVPDTFVAQRVARANAIYAPYGVQFTVRKTVALAAKHAALETREDRDALGAHVNRDAIDCFIVSSLRDVDDPSQLRRGVHWHSRSPSYQGAHFVIVSSVAGPNVLAHELGHYLGNPAHSDVVGNLMSYMPGEGLPVLDPAQQKRVSRAARRFIARR